jgi:hypothetical protein
MVKRRADSRVIPPNKVARFTPPVISDRFFAHTTTNDVRILFNEPDHQYAVHFNQEWVITQGSASTVGSRFFEEFDGPAVARRMVTGRNWHQKAYFRQFWQNYQADTVCKLTEVSASQNLQLM